MFRKKKPYYGAATQKLLDIFDGKYKPDPKQQALLDKEIAEDEARLTNDDRALVAKIEREAAFKKMYVRRSEAEYDMRKAVSNARFETCFYMIFFVVMPLLALWNAYSR